MKGPAGHVEGSIGSSNGSGAGRSLASGAVAGLASVFLLQPLDVVKTRLQELPRCRGTPPFARLGRVLRDTLQADGVAGLWRGTSMWGRAIVVHLVCSLVP